MGKTIIFDVDGTLLDTERIYMRAWQTAAARFGYEIPWEVLQQTRAISTKKAEEIYRRCCGADFSVDMIYPERVRIAEELIAATPVGQLRMPHALTVLKRLGEQGYTLAVASSTGEEKTRAHLAHAGLLDQIGVVVGGDMVERGKPEPDIFLLAARLAGAQPADCVVVGDSPADVGAAFAAGMRMVLIPDQVPLNPYTREHSWMILERLEQLPEAVDRDGCCVPVP